MNDSSKKFSEIRKAQAWSAYYKLKKVWLSDFAKILRYAYLFLQ